jgi:hypothetical protein
MDIATLLQNFTGEKERTAALSAANTALLSGLGLDAKAIEGKTPDEIKALAAAKLAPATTAAAEPDIKTLVSASGINIADGQTAEQALASHVSASRTVSVSLNHTLAALGVESGAVAGKDAAAVKQVIASRVAAKSAEQLAAAGFSAEALKEEKGEDGAAGKKAAKTESTLTGADRIRADISAQFAADPALRVRGGRQPGNN